MNVEGNKEASLSNASKKNRPAAWITWEIQVRNRSMANILGAPLYEIISNKSRLIRYVELTIRTVTLIIKNRFKIIYVQNPSIVLSFIAICLRPLLQMTVIVDAHNGGIYPLEGRSRFLNYFARLICRKADHVIVTNSYLAEVVTQWGGSPFIMPDPIPDFSDHPARKIIPDKPYILFICTWASDEPYYEVIKAASDLNSFDIYVTGNYRKRLSEEELKGLPPSVKLLGFVNEDDYINYFRNAYGALDLTTRDNCLVCGGYEAVALGIPIILSRSRVNEEVFSKGCILTNNDAESIRAAIELLAKTRQQLALDIQDLKHSHYKSTMIKKSQLLERMNNE